MNPEFLGYCWGSKYLPHKILSKTPTHVTVAMPSGPPTEMPRDRIVGQVQEGDRLSVLTCGGNWQSCTAVCGPDRLQVRLDNGIRFDVHNARNLRKHEQLSLLMDAANNSVPVIIDSPSEPIIVSLPVLEDALDGELTRAMESLEPLKEGDRVRIVLAGPPLEHLVGLVGTVEGAETCGLIPVGVEEHGSKLLRREQLDLMDEPESPKMDGSASTKTAETIETSLDAIAIDGDWRQSVAHRTKAPGKLARSPALVST